jgi:hypothetical protein
VGLSQVCVHEGHFVPCLKRPYDDLLSQAPEQLGGPEACSGA